MFQRYVAGQVSKPSGWVGRFLLPRAWERFNRVPNECAYEALNLQADDRVLEIGFGGGLLLEKIDSAVETGIVAGVDHSPAMLARCAKRFPKPIASGKMDLRLGDSAKIPFPDLSFTKVCSVNSVFYWPDPPKVFSEIFRVMREEGKLVLVFTRKASLQKRKFSRHGLNLIDAPDVSRMLTDCGFRNIEERLHADAHREFWRVTATR